MRNRAAAYVPRPFTFTSDRGDCTCDLCGAKIDDGASIETHREYHAELDRRMLASKPRPPRKKR